VLEEFRKGFLIGDKLLRPAMVKVSYTEDAAPAAAEGEAAGEAASGSA
jgi:molecular chaperone GrpE